MKSIFENGRFLVYIAVVSSFIASMITFLWGAIRLAQNTIAFATWASAEAWEPHGAETGAEVGINMIAVVDAFLLATVLYIFAIGLYELFIGTLKVPDWLVIKNLDDLKGKLQSVVIMIMAVLFLEHLAHWKDPLDTLMFAGAIAIVTLALVFYSSSKKPSKGGDRGDHGAKARTTDHESRGETLNGEHVSGVRADKN